MKKIAIFIISFILLLLCIFHIYIKNEKKHAKPTVYQAKMSVLELKNLEELETKSTSIFEVEATEKTEKIEYMGMGVKTEVKVINVIKGDKTITKTKIFQWSDCETLMSKGDKLLLFLKKGIDNPDCYFIVGTSSQGAYRIPKNEDDELQSYYQDNKPKILKELSGSYKKVKMYLMK